MREPTKTMSAAEIAARWGISHQAFYCQAKRHGWNETASGQTDERHPRRVWTLDQVEEMEKTREKYAKHNYRKGIQK